MKERVRKLGDLFEALISGGMAADIVKGLVGAFAQSNDFLVARFSHARSV